MREELDAHLADPALDEQTEKFRGSVAKQKGRWASEDRPEKVDFMTQVRVSDLSLWFLLTHRLKVHGAIIRDYRQRWGDKW